MKAHKPGKYDHFMWDKDLVSHVRAVRESREAVKMDLCVGQQTKGICLLRAFKLRYANYFMVKFELRRHDGTIIFWAKTPFFLTRL